MGQPFSKNPKKKEGSSRKCQQQATLHQPSSGAAEGGAYSELSTKDRKYVADSDTDSSKDRKGDSIKQYRRFEAAVRVWVNTNPTPDTEWDRLRNEMVAASEHSSMRKVLALDIQRSPGDYSAGIPLDSSIRWSALHRAAQLLSADVMNILLSSHRYTDINSRHYNGSTPLMYACADKGSGTPTDKDLSNRRGTVDALLSHGADVHARNDEGKTALQIALQFGHRECAEALFRAGSTVADLKDSERGAASGVIEGMINDQTRDAAGNMDELERIRKKSAKLVTLGAASIPTFGLKPEVELSVQDPASDLSGANCAGEAYSISAAPREMSRLERIEHHLDIVMYLAEALTDRQIATLVTTMVLQEILPGKLKFERDIHTVLTVLCDTMFIAPGKYTDLYKFLVKRSICDVAQVLKHKADQLFGPLSWE